MGTCESGLYLLRDIIRWYYNIIIEYNLDKGLNGNPNLDLDILRFISSIPPKDKILFAHTTNPRIFSNLTNFNSWKIIYIYRDIFEGFVAHMYRHNKEVGKGLQIATNMHQNLDTLYSKAKKQTLLIEFNNLFNNPIEVVNKILKFIQFPEIDLNFLNEKLLECGTFEFIKKNKIIPGTEFNELLDTEQREQVKVLVERNKYVIES
jgi:hypothetical protein